MKLNFSMLKEEKIGFIIEKDNKKYTLIKILKNVKEGKDFLKFQFEDLFLDVNKDYFMHCKIEKKEDVYFFNYVNEKHINGLFGFSMFDTYGFPIDLSKEIMEEKGFNLDENEFSLIMELSKSKSRNTKITKAFN